MKQVNLCSIVLFLILSAQVVCAGYQENAEINTVEVRSNGTVIVIMEAERTNYASCINTTWHKTHWVFSSSSTSYYKEFLSVLLIAKSSNALVEVAGTDNCNVIPGIETIDRIKIL